jgi:hypothetical protein
MLKCEEWCGVSTNAECHFSVVCEDKQSLTFEISIANKSPKLAACDNSEGESASFIEGLWSGDCGELFLCNPMSGFYIELNLSPLGGWWSCFFSAPHKRLFEYPVPLSSVTTTSIKNSNSWSASLTVPLCSLPLELAFDPDVLKKHTFFLCLLSSPV